VDTAGTRSTQDADRDALIAVQSAFWRALTARDRAAFDGLLSVDFVARSPGEPDRDRQSFVDLLTGFPGTVTSVSAQALDARSFGDVGVLTFVQEAEVVLPNGRTVCNRIAVTNVLRRIDGSWRLCLSHAVDIA
jgi:hypothetical protein